MPTVPAKPAVSITENNVAGWSSTLKAALPLNDGAGPPRETVTNGLAMEIGNSINGARNSSFLAKPTWTLNGFPYTTGGDRTLKFAPFSQGLQCPAGTGYSSGSLPAGKTQFATFKVDWPPFNAGHNMWLTSNDIGNGGASMVLSAYTYGNHGAGAFRLSAWNASGYLYPTNDLIVYPGRWYTAAWSHDLNGGAPNVKMHWYLCDWASGATYEDHQTGLSTVYYSAGTTFAFNAIAAGLTSAGTGFVGELHSAYYDGKAWLSADFASYITDLSAPVRGTAYSSSSGTFTAGQAFVGPCTDTAIGLNATRPSGGVTPYSYQWHRQLATAGTFTPGIGNAISGATTQSYVDTPPSQGPWLYKCVASDSTGTPQTIQQLNPASSVAAITQIQAALWPRAPIAICAIGDSITDNLRDAAGIVLTGLTGTEVHWINLGVQGGTTGNGNGTSVGVGTYFLGTHGSPNAGAIPLLWNGSSTSGIAYNASASAVQSALAALPGWTGVTVTGGPLPTVCVIVPPAGIQASTYDLTVGSHTLSNAGGSPAAPWLRSQARLGSQILAADSATYKLVRIHLGANDANGGDPAVVKALIQDDVTFFNSRGQKVALHAGVPRSDANEGQAQNLAKYNDNLAVIVAAVNDPTKCVLGNTTLYNLASEFYSVPYFDSGRIHPTSLFFGALQASAQSLADAVALGVISSGTPGNASDIRSGVVIGGVTGTCAVPTAPNVLSGIAVDNTFGTYVAAPASSVLSTQAFGPGGATQGTYVAPPVNSVLSTQSFGPGGATQGAYVSAPASAVISTATFGPGGSIVGTVIQPATDKVLAPTAYGPGGSLIGTASSGGGSLPADGLDAIELWPGVNVRQGLAVIYSALACNADGLGDTGPASSPTFKDPSGGTVIASTVSGGARTVTQVNLPA